MPLLPQSAQLPVHCHYLRSSRGCPAWQGRPDYLRAPVFSLKSTSYHLQQNLCCPAPVRHSALLLRPHSPYIIQGDVFLKVEMGPHFPPGPPWPASPPLMPWWCDVHITPQEVVLRPGQGKREPKGIESQSKRPLDRGKGQKRKQRWWEPSVNPRILRGRWVCWGNIQIIDKGHHRVPSVTLFPTGL